MKSAKLMQAELAVKPLQMRVAGGGTISLKRGNGGL